MIESLRKTIRTAGEPHVASIHHRILVPSFLAHLTFSSNTHIPPSSTYIYHVSSFHAYHSSLPLSYITCLFELRWNNVTDTYDIIGVRGLFDGISGTWMRQMSYSMCRFWAYDESKKLLGAGMSF
jgi:Mitochondrial carrier protein